MSLTTLSLSPSLPHLVYDLRGLRLVAWPRWCCLGSGDYKHKSVYIYLYISDETITYTRGIRRMIEIPLLGGGTRYGKFFFAVPEVATYSSLDSIVASQKYVKKMNRKPLLGAIWCKKNQKKNRIFSMIFRYICIINWSFLYALSLSLSFSLVFSLARSRLLAL